MNSMERYQKMLSMTPYADRSEMPVFPMMLVPYATFAGMTQAETIADPMKWLQAMEITFEKIGRPDIVMPVNYNMMWRYSWMAMASMTRFLSENC